MMRLKIWRTTPQKMNIHFLLLLDTFQSLQRAGLPLLLVLTGLPTLFPKLVDARTYSERMFNGIELTTLSKGASRDAILKPLESSPIQFTSDSVELIIETAGGYPYFIQFICREFFNSWDPERKVNNVPIAPIIKKLDTQFFTGRWEQSTNRQRDPYSTR